MTTETKTRKKAKFKIKVCLDCAQEFIPTAGRQKFCKRCGMLRKADSRYRFYTFALND